MPSLGVATIIVDATIANVAVPSIVQVMAAIAGVREGRGQDPT
jgi:hypothetical protein